MGCGGSKRFLAILCAMLRDLTHVAVHFGSLQARFAKAKIEETKRIKVMSASHLSLFLFLLSLLW